MKKLIKSLKVVNTVYTVLLAFVFLSSAHAAPLLSLSWEKSFPFGPFAPNQIVQIIGTATNTSTDQAIAICEGVCIGDLFTYSLGALAQIPNGYTFHFGNGGNTALGWLNGQLTGLLLPGAQKDFIFGEYSPLSPVDFGWYGFAAQIQIFAADSARPMINTSTFYGNWEVTNVSPVPEPATYTKMLAGLGLLCFSARRRKQLAAA